jgi:osmotically-inducible protein OsmY
MGRYDSRWGHPGRYEYDQPYRESPPAWGDPNRSVTAGRWQARETTDTARNGFAGDGLYGPARYGLGPYHERLRQRKRPDDELREEVEEALFYDTWVDAEAITVEVEDGVVTLRGALPSYEEIRYATDDAWDVDGVVGVRSELSVRR